MAGLPTYELSTPSIAPVPRRLPDSAGDALLDTSLVKLGGALEGIGNQVADQVGAAALAQSKIDAQAAPVYMPDGTLAPVDLRQPYSEENRAYNAYRISAYTAGIENSAAMKASELQVKHRLNPDGFAQEYQAYVDGTKEGLPAQVGEMMGPRLQRIGQQHALGITQALAKETLDNQKVDTNALVARKTSELVSAVKTGVDPNGDDVTMRLKELQGALDTSVAGHVILPAEAANAMYGVKDELYTGRISYLAEQIRKTQGIDVADAWIEKTVRANGDQIYGDRDKVIAAAHGYVRGEQHITDERQTANYNRINLKAAQDEELPDEDAINKADLSNPQKANLLERLTREVQATTKQAETDEDNAFGNKVAQIRLEMYQLGRKPDATELDYIALQKRMDALRSTDGPRFINKGMSVAMEVDKKLDDIRTSAGKVSAAVDAVRGGNTDTTNVDTYVKATPEQGLLTTRGGVDAAVGRYQQVPGLSTNEAAAVDKLARNIITDPAEGEKVGRFVQQIMQTNRAGELAAQVGADKVAIIARGMRLFDDGQQDPDPTRRITMADALDRSKKVVDEEAKKALATPAEARSSDDIAAAIRKGVDDRWFFQKPLVSAPTPPNAAMVRDFTEIREGLRLAGGGAELSGDQLDAAAVAQLRRRGWDESSMTPGQRQSWVQNPPERFTAGIPGAQALFQTKMLQTVVDQMKIPPEQAVEELIGGKIWPLNASNGADGRAPSFMIQRRTDSGMVQTIRDPNGAPRLITVDNEENKAFAVEVAGKVRATQEALGPYTRVLAADSIGGKVTAPFLEALERWRAITARGPQATRVLPTAKPAFDVRPENYADPLQ